MALPGYRDFGGDPSDVVQDTAGNALANVVLTVYDQPTGGTAITDIKTPAGVSTGGTVTTLDTPNLGRIFFQAPEIYNVVYLEGPGGGSRWRIVSSQFYSISLSSDLDTRVDTLETELGGLTSSVSDLSSSVADMGELIAEAMDTANEALDAAGSKSTGTTVIWRWEGTNLTSGTAAEPFDVNGQALNITSPPILRLDNPSTGPAVVTIDMISPDGVVTELYDTASRPTVNAGVTKVVASLPTTAIITDGFAIQPRLITAPPTGGGGGGGTASVKSVGTTLFSGIGANHSVPKPTGGALGDIVVMVASFSSAVTFSVAESAWELKVSQKSDPTTPRAGLFVWVAPWSSTLTFNITLSSGGVFLAYPLLIQGSIATGTIGNIASSGVNADGLDHTIPGFTSGVATDIVVYAASIWYGANVDGYSISVSSGGSSPVEVADGVSNRTATTNFGLWVATGPGLASGAVLPATNLLSSPGSGAGAPSATSWASAAFSIKPNSGTTPTTYVRLQLDMKGV